ncbi:MAG: CoA pyrophosphatase [Pseudomonadota bacterium]
MSQALQANLRKALAGTSESRRPMVDLEWPKLIQIALKPLLSNLREAAVLVPILMRPQGYSVLLTRRADTLRNHKGQVSFPGGRRDPEDATLAACALREAEEEVGLPAANVEIIGYLDDYPTTTRYRVTPVVALVTPPAQFAFDAGEVAEVFEVPLSLLLDSRRYESKILTKDGLNVPFFEIHHEGHRIWGATAGMLRDFSRKMAAIK